MQRREITLTLAKTALMLRYEAANLYELSAIAGRPWHGLIADTQPRKGESRREAGVRCADLTLSVPLIMAGLAHHDEYASLSHRQLRLKVCGLMDAEARQSGRSVIEVSALAVAEIMPLIAETMVPPGTDPKKKPTAKPPGKPTAKVSTKKS